MAGFRYEKFERAFGFAMSHTVRVREALAEDIGAPSQLDALRGQLATAEKLAEKYLREFEKDDSPSPRAMARLKEVETEENRLRELVLNEEASQKARTPAGQSYEKLQKLDLTNREHRVKFRELVRDVVDHVVIEIGQNRFTIFFKSGKSVEVSVGPAGTWITWRWRGDV